MDFHGFTVENPKRELDFKMSVTAGLQDVNSMYITQKKKHYVFFFDAYWFYFRKISNAKLTKEIIYDSHIRPERS